MAQAIDTPAAPEASSRDGDSWLAACRRLVERWCGKEEAFPVVGWLLIAALTLVWLAVGVYTIATVSTSELLRVAPLVVTTVLLRRFRVDIYNTKLKSGLMCVSQMSAAMLIGVPGAFLAITVGYLFAPTKRGVGGLLFNIGKGVIAYAIGLEAYLVTTAVLPGPAFITQTIGALVAGAIVSLVETWLIAMAVSFVSQRSSWVVWRETSVWLLPHEAIMSFVALGLTLTYNALGLPGLFAYAGPAFLLRYSMKQYVDRTTASVIELRERNSALEQANTEIAAMSERLQETYVGTLQALVVALDTRDNESYGHSMRVAKLTMALAKQMGVEEGSREWIDMERGALLHDVGKIGVPDAILRKPGSLTNEEWAEMRGHARLGFDMLKDIPFLTNAAQVVIAHHERWDGQGYPRGLAGEEVPLGARIFMLADTFDAMASDRPYRKARTYDECLAEITRCGGTQFDPAAVAALQIVFPRWVEIHRSSVAEAKERAPSVA